MKALTISLIAIFMIACQSKQEEKTPLSNGEAIEIAKEAYIFGYPLVLMEYTARVATNIEKPTNHSKAPFNQLSNMRAFPDHTFTDVVKPNVDTYYSIAFFDLTDGPMRFDVPANDRYYLMPFLDAYSNVFAVPGTRTTGTGQQHLFLTGPNWQGSIPEGVTQIEAPTNLVWLVGRTQVNSETDGREVVYPFQDQLLIYPANADPTTYIAPVNTPNPEYDDIVPVEDVRKLPIDAYFNLMSELMEVNPPRERDSAMVKKMAAIGLVAGQPFDWDGLNEELQAELEKIPQEVHAAWAASAQKGNPELLKNGWIFLNKGMGEYGINYGFRAFIAYFGLGANLPDDAIYPSTMVDSEGNRLEGKNNYVLHFEADQLPPVKAFWSLTAYNERDFLVENDINRYSVGDRNPLKYNDDGSLDIYIQNTPPKGKPESNWLPSPKSGAMNLTLRLYWPDQSALDGQWAPPAVVKQL